jgi:hypothetical protein
MGFWDTLYIQTTAAGKDDMLRIRGEARRSDSIGSLGL